MKEQPLRRWLDTLWDWLGGVSVQIKIFGIAFGSTLLLSAVILWQVRSALQVTLAEDLRLRSISLARDLAARATDLVLINDLYGLYRLLQETQANNPDVQYLFIVDPDGQVLAHTFEGGFPLPLLSLNQASPEEYAHWVVLETNEGPVIDVAVPIFEGLAGTARVGVSTAGVTATVNQLSLQLVLTVIVVFLISLGWSTLLTWVLTRPIQDLVLATERIGKGDFSIRLRRWANDEFGDLAEAFNRMAADLAHLDALRRERDQLRQRLLERVLAAQEEERKRIARELHDSTSQSLTSLIVRLRDLADQASDERTRTAAQDLAALARKTLDDVHQLATQLRPAVLDDLGLQAALEHMVEEWQKTYHIPVDLFIYCPQGRLSSAHETALYRIIQEALTNIARHAQASRASVLVQQRDDQIIAIIEDDGRGFSPEKVSHRRLGLAGMQERAELLGGQLTVESAPGQGTTIFVRLPLEAAPPTSPEEEG